MGLGGGGGVRRTLFSMSHFFFFFGVQCILSGGCEPPKFGFAGSGPARRAHWVFMGRRAAVDAGRPNPRGEGSGAFSLSGHCNR